MLCWDYWLGCAKQNLNPRLGVSNAVQHAAVVGVGAAGAADAAADAAAVVAAVVVLDHPETDFY